jgi:DNA-binding transcriptional MerR regulator
MARLANVNVQTVRFYEREGLLAKPSRRLSGYREYPLEAVGLVILIKHIQALGFSLKEIREIMALRKLPSTTFGDAAVRLQSKIEEIDKKIGELRRLRNTLAKMVKTHRLGAATPFAPAFENHVQELSQEAITKENGKLLDQSRKRKNKIPSTS